MLATPSVAIRRILAQAGGIRRDVIEREPANLQGPVTIGSGLVAVGLFAACTWGYAAYRLFLGDDFAWAAAVVIGLLGGWLVFTLDRSLALSMDKRAAWWNTAAQIAARLALAFALAWTMSTPAVLRFSRTVIGTHLLAQQNQMTDQQFRVNAQQTGLDDRKKTAAQLRQDLAALNERLKGAPDDAAYARAKEDAERAATQYEATVARHEPRIQAARQGLGRLRDVAGADAERRDLERQIGALRREINAAARLRTDSRAEEQRIWKAWRADLSRRRDALDTALGAADDGVSRTAAVVETRNRDSAREVEALLVPNLAREYTAFRQITSDPSNQDAVTLSIWALAFHAVFFLLECVPLVLKLTWKRGPIDDAMDAANAEDSNRINLRADTQMLLDQAREEALRELQNRVIEDTLRAHLSVSPIDLAAARRDLELVA